MAWYNCALLSVYFWLVLQSFAICMRKLDSLGKQLPFVLDVCRLTFEKLDQLLHTVCEGLDGSLGAYPPPHQEQECMAIAALNLLKLQVWILLL